MIVQKELFGLAKLEDFGILCKDGKDYAPTHAYRLLIFIRKSIIVPDQPSGLPVGVSGEAGFLRTITDFVRRKSYTPYKIEGQEY